MAHTFHKERCTFIGERKLSAKLPSDKQKKFAENIREELGEKIKQEELEHALTSSPRCSEFIRRHKPAFDQAKLNKAISAVEVVTPQLRRILTGSSTLQEKLTAVRAYRDEGAGFSSLDPKTLTRSEERLAGYWLEGLLATAFDSMGKLGNLLGDDKRRTFDLEGLKKTLQVASCDGLSFDQTPTPVRQIALKLVDEASGKDSLVVSVLPISPVADAQDDTRGYRWTLAASGLPLFNRNQLGEAAKTPGLMLDHVAAFDAWGVKQLEDTQGDGLESEPQELEQALALWDKAFDVLSGLEGVTVDQRGVQGWVGRFMAMRHRHWQIKRRKPVFVLVDGSAAAGITRNVCNVYRQLLVTPELLGTPKLKLFRRIANIGEPPQWDYVSHVEARNAAHLAGYFGHMDEVDKGKREARALDPAQRDVLLALATTEAGQLLAVNGPPGTGKTSMLRAVIASIWIEPLRDQAKRPPCPLILACAATNQAVTNIISSFDKVPGPHLFDGRGQFIGATLVETSSRWLPHLTSYGWYAPASVDGEKDLSSFQVLAKQRPQEPWKFHGSSAAFEQLDANAVRAAYLACAERHFRFPTSLPVVLDRLRDQVRQLAQQAVRLSENIAQWLEAVEALSAMPAWTNAYEDRWRVVQKDAENLFGKNGIRQLNRDEVAQIDSALEKLHAWHKRIGSREQLVELVVAEDLGCLRGGTQRYVHLKQQYRDIVDLSEQLEQWRHVTLIQKLKRAFADLLSRDDTQSRWEALRDAMEACGVKTVPGKPDAAAQSAAVNERRAQLSSMIDIAAADAIRLHLQKVGIGLPEGMFEPAAVATALEARMESLRERRGVLHAEIERLDDMHAASLSELDRLKKLRQAGERAHNQIASTQLAVLAAVEQAGLLADKDDKLLELINAAVAACTHQQDSSNQDGYRRSILKELQERLDCQLRPKLFHLAARYWEGRYVESRLEAEAERRKDAAWLMPSEAQLRQLAMLAPVFVVTAYSAPKLMRRQLCDSDSDMPPFLFGAADLLIVDEAGQGTPEIGASAFALARKAVVVGDIAQLEPVWSLDEASDRLLVQRFSIGPARVEGAPDRYEKLKDAGTLIACGSVMRMAQQATWRTDPEFFPVAGLTLQTHYRCQEPIIQICNRMVYRDQLRVATPRPKKYWRPELQRLGFLVPENVTDTKNPGGSRRNDTEATCIAQWIRENEASLCQHYGVSSPMGLAELVAIVTPFKPQKIALKQALAKAFGLGRFDEADKGALYNKMVIDTVHSLQGAEKPIVIFSMVESSAPREKQFYDDGSNLINVAISRAKDMFVVAMTQAAVDYARELLDNQRRKPSDFLWQAVVQQGSRLNGRRLLVVESPTKQEAIRQALGASIEWKVIATQGHVTQFAPAAHWNIEKAAEPTWDTLEPAAEKLFSEIERLWPDLEFMVLATDPDPEGELIAWHVLRILEDRRASGRIVTSSGRAPQVRRMRFFNLQTEEIQRAWQEAGVGLDAGLVKSALVRGLLDRLIAAHYPRRLFPHSDASLEHGVGRVQLGILDLVNQAAKRACCTYRIQVSMPLADGSQLTTFALHGQTGAIYEAPNRGAAETALKRVSKRLAQPGATVTMTWRGILQQHPPYPVPNTARLLALAWRACEIPPSRAMAALQALYEGTVPSPAVKTRPVLEAASRPPGHANS